MTHKRDHFHILLVDDNPSLLSLYAALLRDAGHQVETATNGTEALDRLTRAPNDPPDLVLLDMEMPEMDGCEAVRRIRADARLSTLPVVALTSHELPEQISRSLDAGCDAYIVKPTRQNALLEELAFFFSELPLTRDVHGPAHS